MTAALHITDSRPSISDPPSDGAWLTVAEASHRLGMNAGHVRRLCADKWQHAGLARWEVGRWQVHVTADPKLAAPAGHDAPDFRGFRGLPHHVRTEAIQKAQCVAAFRAAKVESVSLKQRLPGLIRDLRGRYPALRISRGSLYRWDRDAGDPIDPMELVNGTKVPGDADEQAVSAEAIDHFREIYLDGRAPSLQLCHERTADFAAAHGYTWCSSYQQAKRLKRKIIDRQTELQHRDPRKYQSTCEPWIERDPESFSANECWVSDHRPLDVICWVEDPKAAGGRRYFRPSATVWLDWRTRNVLGCELVEVPNTLSILSALKAALLNPLCAGPPRFAWIDNGRDYDSYTLQGLTKVQRRRPRNTPGNSVADRWRGEMVVEGEQTIFPGVLGLLHIEPHHAIPFRGQGKARCERLFATMGCRFDVSFASYTGRDTTRKPQDLSMHIAAGRAPHFQDVRDRLGDWIAGHIATRDHSLADLSGLSRVEAYQAWSTPAVMPDRQTLEMVCWRWPAPPARKGGRPRRTVGRNGISVTIAGSTIRYGQHDPALRSFKGTDRQVVVCYDPDDINQLYVFDERMALVTVAQRNAMIGRYDDPVTEDLVKSASRARAAYTKAGKVRRKHREHEYLSTEEVAAKAARENPPAIQIEPAASGGVRLVQTRIDQAVKDLQKHPRMRRAAGAETMADDAIGGLADPLDLLAPAPGSPGGFASRAGSGDVEGPLESWIEDTPAAGSSSDDQAPVSWAD